MKYDLSHIMDAPRSHELEWFTTSIAPVSGWFVIVDGAPDDVHRMPAWLTQELRVTGETDPRVFDTRVVASLLAQEGVERWTEQDSMIPALRPVYDQSEVVHESELEQRRRALRDEAMAEHEKWLRTTIIAQLKVQQQESQ